MRSFKLPMTPDQMLAEARRIVGVEIVDEKVREALTVLVGSLNEDAALNEAGAAAWHRNLLRMLCNRLRMQRDFLVHPEIAEQPLLPPLIIWGMFRTGTTKLHKLVAASSDFNWLPFWQSLNPCLITGDRNESPQARMDDTDGWVKWIHDNAPEFKLMHPFATHQVEEEAHILVQSLKCSTFGVRAQVDSYLAWLRTQDATEQMHYLKDSLKYLQWQGYASADKPWILKTPMYLGSEDAVIKVFPTATIVMNHRSPDGIIPSICALLDAYRHLNSDAKVDFSQIVAHLGSQMDGNQAFRERHPEVKIHDIGYRDVVADPLKVIADIYAKAGMKLSDATVKRLTDWEAQNPQHKHGAYSYTLKDFGLSQDGVLRSWSGYIERYGPRFGF